MIFIMKNSSSGRRYDRIEITDTAVTYETGIAQPIVENQLFTLGREPAIESLRSWSNGYVSISEERK